MRKIVLLALAAVLLAGLLSWAWAEGLGDVTTYSSEWDWSKIHDYITIYLAPFGDPQVGTLTSARAFAAGRLADYGDLKASHSGEPTWTLRPVGTTAADIGITAGEDGEFLLTLNRLPSGPVNEEWTISCAWGGDTASKVVELRFESHEAEITLNAPPHMTFFADNMIFMPSAWDAETDEYYRMIDYEISPAELVETRLETYDDGSFRYEPYGATLGLGTGTFLYGSENLRIVWQADVRVADENGVVPGLDTAFYSPDSLTLLDAQALAGTDFESVVIGRNVKRVASGALANMPHLKEVVFVNPDTEVPEDLFGDDPERLPYIVCVEWGSVLANADTYGWPISYDTSAGE